MAAAIFTGSMGGCLLKVFKEGFDVGLSYLN